MAGNHVCEQSHGQNRMLDQQTAHLDGENYQFERPQKQRQIHVWHLVKQITNGTKFLYSR